MKSYCLITHPVLKNIENKSSKLMINDFMNIALDVTNYETPDRNLFYKMPSDNELSYLEEIKKKIQPKFFSALNIEHKSNFKERYWSIIAGYYLKFMINICYERWTTTKKILEKYQIDNIPYVHINSENVNLKDTSHFGFMASDNDNFNHFLYIKAIEFQNKYQLLKEISLEDFDKKNRYSEFLFKSKQKEYLKKNFLNRIFNFFKLDGKTKFSRIKSKFQKIKTYFSIIFYQKIDKNLSFVLLNNSLSAIEKNSIYRNYKMPELDLEYIKTSLNNINQRKYDLKRRSQIISDNIFTDNLENYIWNCLISLMPQNYLENFEKIQLIFKKNNFNFKTKKILINGTRCEDSLNMWIAKNVHENKTELRVFQQGGGHGSDRYNVFENQDIEISDKFFTYGWSKKNVEKVIPFGVLNTAIKPYTHQKELKNKESCTLIGYNLSKYSFLYEGSRPRAPNTLDYLNAQMNLYQMLNKDIKENVIIRPKPYFTDTYSEKLWRKKFPNIKLDLVRKDLNDIFLHSKLMIVTYNASTTIQCIFKNIPTIIFLDKRFYNFRDYAKSDYEEFRKLGVFFDDYSKAANKINEIWNYSEEWWFQEKIQEFRKEFCKKYFNFPIDISVALN